MMYTQAEVENAKLKTFRDINKNLARIADALEQQKHSGDFEKPCEEETER